MSAPTSAGLHDTAFEVVVADRTPGSTSVELFTLAARDGGPLPRWLPGAHVDVVLPSGDVRQYSLCGDPGADRWRIGVLREPDGRGGSAWLHDAVAVGDVLRVAGPRNHFEFEARRGTSYRFVAGGVGITPLSTMAAQAAAAGLDYELHYTGRSRSTMALLDELAALHGERLRVYAGDEGARLDLDDLFAGLPPFTTTYCCGPERLLDAVEAAGAGRQVVVERFEPKAVGEPVRHEAFEVELALSGVTVTVPPDKSVLDVVEDAGVLVLSSCREGTCGTCETVVLEGEVDHRDSILSPDEQAANDRMFVCVSRAACPRLVLDL